MMNENDWEMFKQLIKTQEGRERFLELIDVELLNKLGLIEEDKVDMEIEDFIERMDCKLKN